MFLGCARTASGSLRASLGLSLDVLGCSWGPLGIYLRAPSWDVLGWSEGSLKAFPGVMLRLPWGLSEGPPGRCPRACMGCPRTS